MNATSPHDTFDAGWRLENTYTQLLAEMFADAMPAAVPAPKLAIVNHTLAAQLGLDFDGIADDALAALFAGQTLPPGSKPIAQAYAGHQYGGFTMLGDGRAILLGEQRTPDGRVFDIQLKGGGRTRFSRGGDGKAAIAPMLREYVISEAMHALGIPTTRSLAVVTTGEAVFRTKPQSGAILVRVAASHIRVGTFEYAARRGETALRALADYAIARHYPGQSHRDFFAAVCDRQASLIAKWQRVGFVHGVMNTDNMAISGETIDYGPCAFMNAYDPATVFSGIDAHGRYAYGNQPRIAQWNLARLGETLLPLFDADAEKAVGIAMEILEAFPMKFEKYSRAGMRAKLGLLSEDDGDSELIESLLAWMLAAKADFTNTFRDLTWSDAVDPSPASQAWHRRRKLRIQQQGDAVTRRTMQAANPMVIPRNHRVEEALAAAEAGDFAVLHRLLDVLKTPFEMRDGLEDYMQPQDDVCYRTHCGT